MPSDGRASRLGVFVFFTVVAFAMFGAGMATRGAVSPTAALVAFVPVVVAIVIGVRFPAAGIFARPILRGVTQRRELALTFDDGPDPRWTPAVLDLLDARNQKATFFVIGNRAQRHPELLRDMLSRGHEIANHTWSHSYLTPFMSPRALADEIAQTNRTVEAAVSVKPRWFRPPVGLMSPRVAAGADRAGIEIVCWSATARDGVERTTVEEAVARLQDELVPGAILVLHDARMSGAAEPIAPRVLSQVLDRMDRAGLRSVTLSELLG